MSRLVHAPLLAALLSLVSAPAAAEPLEDIFSAANHAYFAGDYTAAAAGYQRLVDAGIADADVYYDLGLAQARRGEDGRAILAFERALALRPSDEGAAAALEHMQLRLGERRAAKEGEASTRNNKGLLSALGSLFSEPTLAYALLGFNVLAFACLALLTRAKRESLRIGLGVGASVAFLFLTLTGLALLGRREATEPGIAAIVLDDHTMMREGPDPSARPGSELREGERVRVLTRHDAYFEILRPSGERGWAPSSAVGQINPHLADS